MNVNEEDYWAGISAPTSVREVAATTGGHGEPISHVASGLTSAWNSAGPSSCNVAANTHKQEMMQHTSAVVFEDLDYKGVSSIYNDDDEDDDGDEDIIQSSHCAESASSAPIRGPLPNPKKEGFKSKSEYKAAVKLCSRFDGKSNLSREEAESLASAKYTIEKARAHYAARSWCRASDMRYANQIEEEILKNIKHSTERAGPSSRRQTQQKEVQKRETLIRPKSAQAISERLEEHFKPKRVRVASEEKETPSQYKATTIRNLTTERPFVMALIDHSDANSIMSKERWNIVEMKLLEAMFIKMNAEPDEPLPKFDNADWFDGVKLIKCKNNSSLKWLQTEVKTLQGLWNGARLDVVDRKAIPTLPQAKVFIPQVVNPEHALRLLQRQNPDVPTADWKVLVVAPPPKTGSGQTYTLQINEEAENILCARRGHMTWGVGNVRLRVKKRHPTDNRSTLEAEKVEDQLAEQLLLPRNNELLR